METSKMNTGKDSSSSNVSQLQDSAERIFSDAKSKATGMVEEFSDYAGELLEGNGAKIAGAAAVVIAAGALGYMIGRGTRE